MTRLFLLRMRNVSDKSCRAKISISCPITVFRKSCRLSDSVKICYSRAGHRWQYGACTMHTGYLRLQKHPKNMKCLLLFHCNNGCTNALQCYVKRTLSVLLKLYLSQ